MTATIEAAVFDAYGTLFDVNSIAALADEIFPGAGGALSVHWRDKQLEYTRLRTLSARYADFWTVTGDALDFSCERLGLVLRSGERQRLMGQYAALPAYADSASALRELKRMGVPLAILSNGTLDMLAGAVAAAGMEGLFDHVLSVDRVKKFKTAPEVYELATEALRCPAGRILFVSSNGWDACAATWFGFTTLWINRGNLPPERLGVAPHAVGRGMQDVVRFLERQELGKRGP